MFNDLRNLKYKRGYEEALGFYLAYTLLLIVSLFLIGGFMASSGVMGHNIHEIRKTGHIMGALLNILFCCGTGMRILLAKRMAGWPAWVLIFLTAIASGLLPWGGVAGMAIVAYMTTRPNGWPYGEKRRLAAARKAGQTKVAEPPLPAQAAISLQARQAARKERIRPDILDPEDTAKTEDVGKKP